MDTTPLQHIPRLSQRVFQVWRQNARKYHPKLDLQAERKQLTDDFKRALQHALQDLERKDYRKNRQRNGWAVGVCMELLAKHLNYHWYNVYVLSAFPAYRASMWMKAMLMHLEASPEAQIAVNRLYKMMLDKRFPFEQLQEQHVSEDELVQNRLVADLSYQHNWAENRGPLNDLLRDHFEQAIDQRGPRMLTAMDLYDILDLEALHYFIELNLHILK